MAPDTRWKAKEDGAQHVSLQRVVRCALSEIEMQTTDGHLPLKHIRHPSLRCYGAQQNRQEPHLLLPLLMRLGAANNVLLASTSSAAIFSETTCEVMFSSRLREDFSTLRSSGKA